MGIDVGGEEKGGAGQGGGGQGWVENKQRRLGGGSLPSSDAEIAPAKETARVLKRREALLLNSWLAERMGQLVTQIGNRGVKKKGEANERKSCPAEEDGRPPSVLGVVNEDFLQAD